MRRWDKHHKNSPTGSWSTLIHGGKMIADAHRQVRQLSRRYKHRGRHLGTLHGTVSLSLGHGSPPCVGSVATERWRVAVQFPLSALGDPRCVTECFDPYAWPQTHTHIVGICVYVYSGGTK